MTEHPRVQGLFYIPNAIDKEYAETLLSSLDSKGQWVPLTTAASSRKVQHYGYKYGYKTKRVDEKTDPIPDFLLKLQKDLQEITQVSFNQIIVNNYEPGQGISKHIDSKDYGPTIACYTIAGGATMRFRKGDEIVDIYTEPNSLYIMTEDSRYKWTHEMPSLKSDLHNLVKIARSRRVSITFRTVS